MEKSVDGGPLLKESKSSTQGRVERRGEKWLTVRIACGIDEKCQG